MGLDITGRHASGVKLDDALIKAAELFLAFLDELRLKAAISVSQWVKLNVAVNSAYWFTAFTVKGVASIFTGRIMFGITKMLLHLGFKSTLSKLFSQLLKDTLLTKQVLRGFVIS